MSAEPAGLVRLRARLSARSASLGNLQREFAGLLPFQREGVRQLIGYPLCGRAILADDMGLGKTVQALQFAAHYGGRLLVLCPAYLQCNWQAEIVRWMQGRDNADVFSYDRLRNLDIDFEKYSVLIADEAHYLKDCESMRFRAARPLLHGVRRVLLLTGTPCPNKPIELWSLLYALRPGAIPSLHAFGRRYCAAKRTRYGWEARGATRKEELNWWLMHGFMVRRTKKEVLRDLPAKNVRNLRVQPSDEDLVHLAKIEEELEDAKDVLSKQRLVSALFHETSRAKTKAVIQVILGMAAHSDPLIVFGHHRNLLDAVQEAACGAGWRVARIDGATPSVQRHAVAEDIQAGKVDVAVLSMLAAGTGLTLTASHRVVFAELYWVPAVIQQAEDRTHRIGQQHPVHITRIVANDTVDERVLRCLQKKCKQNATILNTNM